MTEITQADRDAAEAYREKVLDAIWVGGPEDQVLLEAFSRHRMEATEALSAENERLREALLQMKRIPNYIRKDDNRKEMLKIINAALGETK